MCACVCASERVSGTHRFGVYNLNKIDSSCHSRTHTPRGGGGGGGTRSEGVVVVERGGRERGGGGGGRVSE